VLKLATFLPPKRDAVAGCNGADISSAMQPERVVGIGLRASRLLPKRDSDRGLSVSRWQPEHAVARALRGGDRHSRLCRVVAVQLAPQGALSVDAQDGLECAA
jgi:hypothetical protein